MIKMRNESLIFKQFGRYQVQIIYLFRILWGRNQCIICYRGCYDSSITTCMYVCMVYAHLLQPHFFISYSFVKELHLFVAANLIDLLRPSVQQFFRSLFYRDLQILCLLFCLLAAFLEILLYVSQ